MAFTKAEPGKTKIGWIGTGVMGRWMCQHLMSKGYKATVYNRSKDKAQPLIDAGAAWADTPQAAGREIGRGLRHRRLPEGRARGFPRQQGGPGRQQAGHGAGRHDHQRSVAGPGDLRGGQGEGRGQPSMRRCPAATSAPRTPPCRSWSAATRTWSRRSSRCSSAWARRSSIRAPPGAGQHTKMVNQILIAGNMVGVCEALLYAYKAGLDLKTVLQVGRRSARPGAGR